MVILQFSVARVANTYPASTWKSAAQHKQQYCSHEEELGEMELAIDGLTDIKKEINDDLRRQRNTIAQYQEFYEQYGSSNQENAVTELAEIPFASNYAKYDELKDKLDKIDKEIDSYVEKMDTIIEQGQAEKCACAQEKTVI